MAHVYGLGQPFLKHPSFKNSTLSYGCMNTFLRASCARCSTPGVAVARGWPKGVGGAHLMPAPWHKPDLEGLGNPRGGHAKGDSAQAGLWGCVQKTGFVGWECAGAPGSSCHKAKGVLRLRQEQQLDHVAALLVVWGSIGGKGGRGKGAHHLRTSCRGAVPSISQNKCRG
eukprot:1157516-Pelagomonas_calceolata.AAC.8